MKLKIKMPSKQFDVEIEPSASVADLRKVVASAVEKKEEQMVLIFGGKILKDTDTVESHSIKDGQAVHLVVKQPRQEDPKPAAETSSAPAPGPASTTTSTTPSSTTRASPTAASTNPFAALAGGMAGSGGMGNMQQQAQQMMQNPQAMQEMMNSPMMQAIMENPDVMQSIIQSNPQMRQLMETNPEIGHILNNPEHMRQAMEMMRNPSMMQEMMRNQDRALSNLESLPGGFNALQRFYNERLLWLEGAPWGPALLSGGGDGKVTTWNLAGGDGELAFWTPQGAVLEGSALAAPAQAASLDADALTAFEPAWGSSADVFRTENPRVNPHALKTAEDSDSDNDIVDAFR